MNIKYNFIDIIDIMCISPISKKHSVNKITDTYFKFINFAKLYK